MRISRILLVGVLFVGGYAAAVPPGCMAVPHAVPDDLRSSLKERLSIFIAAQAEKRWGDVEELLGRCRFGCEDDDLYTSSYKQCLVSRMQEVRMLAFDFSIQDLSTCSTKIDLPAGTVDRFEAEQLSWYLIGTGKFQTSSEAWMEQTRVVAYRDHGQWYFIPPQRDMQSKWGKVHYTLADFARDRREEVEIRNSPFSPVEITNVHVYMDRQYPSGRIVHFKLRNKTSKKVIALSMGIGDESGVAYLGGPYRIAPKGYLALEDDFSVYSDFCDGIRRKHAMAIEEVDFSDGSKWEFKRSGD
jgi:hypothetical protein